MHARRWAFGGLMTLVVISSLFGQPTVGVYTSTDSIIISDHPATPNQ